MAEEVPQPTNRLLGKRLATYRGLPAPTGMLAVWAALGLLLWLHLASPWLSDPTQGMLGLTGLGLLALAHWWMRLPRRLDLHQHGFEYRTWGRPRRVYWNQLSEIYQQPVYSITARFNSARRDWVYRLVCRDGSRLQLRQLEGLHDLGRRIEEQFAVRHLPMVLSAFNSGYTVRFGRRLALHADGLQVGKQYLGWHDIAEIALGVNDELRITCRAPHQPPLRVPCRLIANLRILDGVLEAVRSGEADDQQELEVHQNRTGLKDSSISFASVGEENSDPWSEDWEGEEDDRETGRPRQPR